MKTNEEIVDEVIKTPRRRLLNWIDKLEPSARDFVNRLKEKQKEGVYISATRTKEKLEEHFGVYVSTSQVRRFLIGELNAEESIKTDPRSGGGDNH